MSLNGEYNRHHLGSMPIDVLPCSFFARCSVDGGAEAKRREGRKLHHTEKRTFSAETAFHPSTCAFIKRCTETTPDKESSMGFKTYAETIVFIDRASSSSQLDEEMFCLGVATPRRN